jgi:putative AdoMet-dependent methyltransferase
MRSAYADAFNHDQWAADYDADVSDESNPIRTGYKAVLRWVVNEAKIDSSTRVLDLGSGTGNLSACISECRELVCVDVSERMQAIAERKLVHLPQRRFIKEDILAVLERDLGTFDCIISTYSIHHLTETEKGVLFDRIHQSLRPGGRAVFGDLMLENAGERVTKAVAYRTKGDTETAEAIETEFFWVIDTAVTQLRKIGFTVAVKRFTDLSFGIAARVP